MEHESEDNPDNEHDPDDSASGCLVLGLKILAFVVVAFVVVVSLVFGACLFA